MRIELRTRDGGIVHDAEIPPFEPPPEVVSWGTRIFVHQGNDTDGGPEQYREGLLWPLVEIAVDARRI